MIIVLHYINTETGNKTTAQNAFRARFRDHNPAHSNLAKYSSEGITSLKLNKFGFMHLSVWEFFKV